MSDLKKQTESKMNTVLTSPLLSRRNKITALHALKNEVLARKGNKDLSTMLEGQKNYESSNRPTLQQGHAYQKSSSNRFDMKKAGVASPLMIIVTSTMVATSMVLIGIIIGSFF